MIDLSEWTNDEILALIKKAKDELKKRDEIYHIIEKEITTHTMGVR